MLPWSMAERHAEEITVLDAAAHNDAAAGLLAQQMQPATASKSVNALGPATDCHFVTT